MAGIRLEFAQFGHFDSFDIIRSLTSMNGLADNQLPQPISTGLTSMYYVDSSVIEGQAYYYKVRVWRGLESIISDEIQCIAVSTINYDFSDLSGLEIFGNGSQIVEVSGNGLIVGADSAQSIVIRLVKAQMLKNFDAEFDLSYLSANNSTTILLVFRNHIWTSDAGKLTYFIGLNHRFTYAIKGTSSETSSNETTIGGGVDTMPFFQINQKKRVKITVRESTFQIYLDNNLLQTITDSTHMNAGGIGFRMWTDGNARAKIGNLVITPR